MSREKRVLVGAGWVVLLSLGSVAFQQAQVADEGAPLAWSAEEIRRVLQHSPLPAPPPDPTNRFADDPRAARLGQMLFFEPRLSASDRFSCASCHVPHHTFADGHALAEGMGPGRRNTPSLWNVAYNRWFFWDGRADTLWSQALHPIEAAEELAGSRFEVARLVATDRGLNSAYREVFGAPPERKGPFGADPAEVDRLFANVGKSLAAYQRRLISSHSPFDRFARALKAGDVAGQQVLSVSAQRGLKLFVGKGECRLCHAGPNFSDGEFHDTGVPARSGLAPDLGRFAGVEKLLRDPWNAASVFSDDRDGPMAARLRRLIAGREARGQFKTPSLRNVAQTAPYMHQGQLETLRQVVGYYATLRGATFHHDPPEALLVPRHFNEGEINDLIAFLESLTDEGIEPELLRAPRQDAIQVSGLVDNSIDADPVAKSLVENAMQPVDGHSDRRTGTVLRGESWKLCQQLEVRPQPGKIFELLGLAELRSCVVADVCDVAADRLAKINLHRVAGGCQPGGTARLSGSTR